MSTKPDYVVEQHKYYQIRRLDRYGKPVMSYTIAPEGYSRYYHNDCQYTHADALAHVKELEERNPGEKYVVTMVTMVEILAG